MTELSPIKSVHSGRGPFLARWLARLTFRRKLALIIGVPSAVALLGSALALGRVSSAYQRSLVLERANTSSSLLIQAAAAQAKERGFAAAALSDPAATATRQTIAGQRAEGDRLLEAALREAESSLAGNPVLSATRQRLLDARLVRDRKREEVDASLGGGQPAPQPFVQEWFDTQTRLIGAERVFGNTLFLAQNPYELTIQYNGFIKANVFVASEFAGRERARIGRFIATGQPIPPERLEELQRWRGVVEENLAALVQLRANPAMPAAVLGSIAQLESEFLGDYQKVRASVYAASARREPYPLSTDAWIAASTRGINSILAVSERIGEEAARISRQQADFSSANELLIAGMAGLFVLAMAAGVVVARHLSRRLGELRAAAERVTSGDYSQPVGEAGTGDEPGDEFAVLAGVFNTMQIKVQAGVEQLRAEKAGVETRVRERTRELSEANGRLVTLNADKDTFLGICSHDLKNPLSGIVGLAGLLQDDAEDAGQVRAHAADVLHSAEFMFQLVTNLLDLSAIEQGTFNLTLESLDLQALVVRGTEAYRRRAEEKGIRLRVSAPDAEVTAYADARATAQLVDNLVSNAVKFTPPGGTVTVSVTGPGSSPRQPPPAGDLAPAGPGFAVQDSGPGLSAADQAKLFQKYTRLTPRATGGEHSTGLGLSIVKRLAEAMGGEVRCRSEPGAGCTFSVELRCGPADDAARKA